MRDSERSASLHKKTARKILGEGKVGCYLAGISVERVHKRSKKAPWSGRRKKRIHGKVRGGENRMIDKQKKRSID